MNPKPRIQIELTPEQTALMEAVTRRPTPTGNLKLQIEELESRITLCPATSGVWPVGATK